MKYTLIAIAVCVIVAATAAYFFSFSFLASIGVFCIAAVSMVLNEILAKWEDQQPGGFLIPNPQKIKKEN
jgi:hypothetical protein